MKGARLRRWVVRGLLAAAAGHVVGIGAIASVQIVDRLEIARRYRHESLAAAQERLLGSDYMDSVRQIRAVVAEHETVYLVDREASPSGAAYFALHYLAPRRVVFLGAPRRESPKLVRSRLPRDARWVVVVQAVGAPLELVPADRLRPGHRRRGS